ncbi:MAG: hypothetical protein EA400_09760 [Chromatiaceae bacterium]|nr:MAG: hypothetical protein EA400_09760 [Chromatiaceae bacterium]
MLGRSLLMPGRRWFGAGHRVGGVTLRRADGCSDCFAGVRVTEVASIVASSDIMPHGVSCGTLLACTCRVPTLGGRASGLSCTAAAVVASKDFGWKKPVLAAQ